MENQIRNVFISHKHDDDEGLKDLKGLMARHGISCRDYSIRSDNPNNAHNEDYIKYEILGPRIKQSGCLVVYISDVTHHSDWVNWEIEYARKEGKRIVGVWARGDLNCEVPESLRNHGDAVVGWNGESIVDAVNGVSNRWYNRDGSDWGYVDIPRHTCS